MVCYDGFLLSHTVMPVECPSRPRSTPSCRRPRAAAGHRPGRSAQHRPGHARRPPRERQGDLSHGYMELRALHQRALRRPSRSCRPVDEQYGQATGRSWGGLVLARPARRRRIALIAAGSLAHPAHGGGRRLAGRGDQGRRARHPRLPSLPGRGAARRARRPQGRARLRQGASYGFGGPICNDLRAALVAAPTRRRCSAPSPASGAAT